MGPIRYPETSVKDYHSTLRYIPEKRRFQLRISLISKFPWFTSKTAGRGRRCYCHKNRGNRKSQYQTTFMLNYWHCLVMWCTVTHRRYWCIVWKAVFQSDIYRYKCVTDSMDVSTKPWRIQAMATPSSVTLCVAEHTIDPEECLLKTFWTNIWGFTSDVSEVAGLLDCDAVLLGEYFLTFRRTLLSPSSGSGSHFGQHRLEVEGITIYWNVEGYSPQDIDFSRRRDSPLVGQGLLIIGASRSHSDTPHSVGLLWTSDQPEAETPAWQHTTLTRDRQTSIPPVGFEPAIPTSELP
jgi:hypothetical protein